MTWCWLAAPLVFVLISIQARAADDALTREVNGRSFDQFVEATLSGYGVPGAVVVVARSHGSVFLKGYGVRRQGSPEKVDENTRFQLASVSKFIAATAVGSIVDRGTVTWDRRCGSSPRSSRFPYLTRRRTRACGTASRIGQGCPRTGEISSPSLVTAPKS